MHARKHAITGQTAATGHSASNGFPDGKHARGALFWRQALCGLVSAAFRVHHYRDVHSRMLRDALRERDCGPESPSGNA